MVWYPIAQSIEGKKLLLVDSYPIHREMEEYFIKYDTIVLYIPPGKTGDL